VSKVWKNSKNQIAFTRGNVGFIAFNADNSDMIENIDVIITFIFQNIHVKNFL
jgi:hypothetical protein